MKRKVDEFGDFVAPNEITEGKPLQVKEEDLEEGGDEKGFEYKLRTK